jgi:hypothetical protein
VLSEALSRDPSGLEAGDRQQLERLAATLHRWVPNPSRVLFVPFLCCPSGSSWSGWQQHCTGGFLTLAGFSLCLFYFVSQTASGAPGSNTAQMICAG